MIITDQEGRSTPNFIDNFEYYSIATTDFSPFENPSLSASEIGGYIDKGFLVMPHADGTIYGITWRDFVANGKKLTIATGGIANLTPKIYKGSDGQWIPTRWIKIYASNDGTFPSVATTVNIDIPL